MSAFQDLTGMRFGKLTVVELAPRETWKSGKTRWICLCDCGCYKSVASMNLKKGNTVSCSCYTRANAAKRLTKHGYAATKVYRAWQAIQSRCENPRMDNYKYYGSRGIKVCDRWKGDGGFQNFLEDMGVPPSKKHSIDRIDPSKDYAPDNCRWATQSEQMKNTRKNRKIEYQGEVKILAEWARTFNIHAATLIRRIDAGWPVEDALKIPPVAGRRHRSQYKKEEECQQLG